MSIKNADTGVCWYFPLEGFEDREWIAHYSTEAEALADLEEDERDDDFFAPAELSWRCILLRCDTCGQHLGMDGEMEDHGMHINPDDLSAWLNDGWTTTGHNVHRCPDCPGQPDEEDLSRRPGPDDIPLFNEGDLT